ncbi:hypothetical protein F4805DRAFT_460083 [Annulohypoxylon moriforme]|nr:hypothetical protein F4805DRAFT_460083 [Annulohypoxylon moriforme]
MAASEKDDDTPGLTSSGEYSDNNDNNDEGSSLIVRPRSPNTDFERVEIGGADYDQRYKKYELCSLARDAKEQPPGRFRLELARSVPGVTFQARGHEEAIEYAVQASMVDSQSLHPRLVIYADGSVRPQKFPGPFKAHDIVSAGFGIAYKQFNFTLVGAARDEWTDVSYGVQGVVDNEAAEVLALHRSLWLAYYVTIRYIQEYPEPQDGTRVLPSVTILSDSIGAINYIKLTYHNGRLKVKGVQPLGASLNINWVPGHVDIEGNVRADQLAVLGALASGLVGMDTSFQGIFPVRFPLPKIGPAIFSDIHLGKPKMDFLYWQKEETKAILKDLTGDDLLEYPTKERFQILRSALDPSTKPVTGKRKRDYSDDETEDPHLEPPTKKSKSDPEESTQSQTFTQTTPTIRGLLCWKE